MTSATHSYSLIDNILTGILLRFCHEPWPEGKVPGRTYYYSIAKGLLRWKEVLPDMESHFVGARVIDFGCGEGYQAAAMAEGGAASVLGIEIDPPSLARCEQTRSECSAAAKLTFATSIPEGEVADLITSQNSFEHFVDAVSILAIWKRHLSPGGKILVTFSPPWYSPWGDHMAYFCSIPWVNLLFPERVVLQVRARFRKDDVRSYEDAGLARMSLNKFERLIATSGFVIRYAKLECSWGLHFFKNLPYLRELFVNRVTVILGHAPAAI